MASVLLAAHAAILVTAPRVARAQTDDEKEHAKDLFSAALDLRAKGDEEAALEKFKGAYELLRSPITALEYGRSLMLLGHLVEAHTRLQEAATLPEKSTESDNAKAARKEAATLADDVVHRTPTLVITLIGTQDVDVDVSIDGRRVAYDQAIPINPGKHRIEAELAGGSERHTDVTVKEGEARKVALAFGAAGETKDGNAAAAKPSSTLTYVAFGVAGVSFVVGGITGLIAKSNASALEHSKECHQFVCGPSEYDSVDAYHRMATISTISFVITGVAAGVGVVSLLTGASDEHTTAACEPWIGLGSAGIAGAF